MNEIETDLNILSQRTLNTDMRVDYILYLLSEQNIKILELEKRLDLLDFETEEIEHIHRHNDWNSSEAKQDLD